MNYRTKTYVAGDWDGDQIVINKLFEWKNSGKYNLSFTDAHNITQARDGSLNCSIKRSLKSRLDVSKTFVLIVGDKTKDLRSGGCQLCQSYNRWTKSCARGYSVDYRSYVDYECDVAAKDVANIVVIYNSTKVNKSKCPDSLKEKGIHIPAYYWENGKSYWNYQAIKNAIDK